MSEAETRRGRVGDGFGQGPGEGAGGLEGGGTGVEWAGVKSANEEWDRRSGRRVGERRD